MPLFRAPDGSEPKPVGLPTGYLYEMETFEQVKEAYQNRWNSSSNGML